MENLNAEQIKTNIEACIERECENCSYDEQTSCKETMLCDTLALITSQEQRIKELAEENKAWQKHVVITEEKAGKAYYDLACEVENLRAENENLHASCTELTRNLNECKADTVRKMQERVQSFLTDEETDVIIADGDVFVPISAFRKIAKEMLEGENEASGGE